MALALVILLMQFYVRFAVFQPRRTNFFRNCYRVALVLQVSQQVKSVVQATNC